MNANLVFAPLEGTNALYETAGIDLMLDRDLAETGESLGAADHVQWVEYAGPKDEWGAPAADELLRGKGFRRVGEWDTAPGEYAVASIEPIA